MTYQFPKNPMRQVRKQIIQRHAHNDPTLRMRNKHNPPYRRVAETGLEVIIRHAHIHSIIAEIALDQAFHHIRKKTIPKPPLQSSANSPPQSHITISLRLVMNPHNRPPKRLRQQIDVLLQSRMPTPPLSYQHNRISHNHEVSH